MTVSLNKKTVIYTAIIAIAMMASFVFVRFNDDKTYHICLNAIWLVSILIIVVSDAASLNASVLTKVIVFTGLSVRIVVIVFALGSFGPITDFLYSHDPSGFRWNAYNYYAGDFSFDYTRYPYVINAIFHIFGPYMLMPHLINVLLWYLGFRLLVYGVASAKNLRGIKKQVLTAFYWLMPMQILWTSALYRESILAFFIVVCISFVAKWREKLNFVYIVMAVLSLVPCVLLHGGNAAVFVAVLLTYVLWNKKSEAWDIMSWKMVLIVGFLLFLNPVYEFAVANFASGYFPPTLSFSTIAKEGSTEVLGRADYITGHTVATNVKEFVVYSAYRMFYFWASPTPKYWGEATDVLAFFVDTIPWLIFLCCYVKQMKKCKTSAGWIGVFLFLAYTLVYGWGTSNAGTAIRHRGEMIAPLTFLFMYMIQNETGIEENVVEE